MREVKEELARGAQLRGIFQQLVLESGLNWAADAGLRAFMLEEAPRAAF